MGIIVIRMFLLLPIFCSYFFLIYLFVTAEAALPKKTLVFIAWQILNNLLPIAKKLLLHFLVFRIISLPEVDKVFAVVTLTISFENKI